MILLAVAVVQQHQSSNNQQATSAEINKALVCGGGIVMKVDTGIRGISSKQATDYLLRAEWLSMVSIIMYFSIFNS